MSNSNDYNNGYWAGSDSGYHRGYEDGVRAEHDRAKRALDGNSFTNEPATLGTMIFGSIILTLCGWCFVGIFLFLFWITGSSESWWFPWVWRITYWGGIGFIVIMSITGIITTVTKHCKIEEPPEKPVNNRGEARVRANDQNLWKKKYPIGDTETVKEADVVKNQGTGDKK